MKGASSDPPEVANKLWSGWSGKVAWDIGANLGQSISQLLDLFDRVESFEPATESYAAMALDWLDESRVRLHRIAVSDHDGILETSVREIPIQTGQLVAVGMPYDDFVPGVSSPQEDGLPWGQELAIRPVLCRSVDSLISDLGVPDFVKVDTEGGEVSILEGASNLLRLGKTGWLIEFHSESNLEKCMKLLEETDYDFEVEVVRHPHYKSQSFLWKQHGWLRVMPIS